MFIDVEFNSLTFNRNSVGSRKQSFLSRIFHRFNKLTSSIDRQDADRLRLASLGGLALAGVGKYISDSKFHDLELHLLTFDHAHIIQLLLPYTFDGLRFYRVAHRN